MKPLRHVISAALMATAAATFAQAGAIKVEKPFARATAPGAAVGGGGGTRQGEWLEF